MNVWVSYWYLVFFKARIVLQRAASLDPLLVNGKFTHKSWFRSVLRIRDILVRIQIRGSVPLTNGSGSAPAIFVIDLQDGNKKQFSFPCFSAYYFSKVHSHHIFKDKKSYKEVTKKKESRRGYLIFLLDNRSIRVRTSD
jgi:hypothetical protein